MKNFIILFSFLLLTLQAIAKKDVVIKEYIDSGHAIGRNYPRQLALAGIEGYVKVEFSIHERYAKDIKIVESYPENVFDKAMFESMKYPYFIQQVTPENNREMRYQYNVTFTLGDSSNLELMAKRFAEQNAEPQLLLTDIQVKPTKGKKRKNNQFTYYTYDDVKNKFIDWSAKDHFSLDNQKLKIQIGNRLRQQFQSNHGAYKQFYQINTSSSHLPISLSDCDSIDLPTNRKKLTLASKLTIDQLGHVTKYRLLGNKKKLKRLKLSVEQLDKFILNLKFIAAKRDGKNVTSTINAKLSMIQISQQEMWTLWAKDKYYKFKKPPNHWVRMALLINKNGKVKNTHVLESSDAAFESQATQGIKKYRFPKEKTDYQMIKLIEFKLAAD